MLLHLAAGLYLVNCLVGVAAQLGGVGFGIWHHALYALVFAAAIAALLANFHPGLLLSVTALAAFPRARPRTVWHPTLAAIGLLGHAVTLLSRA
jgi:hypothetical protein